MTDIDPFRQNYVPKDFGTKIKYLLEPNLFVTQIHWSGGGGQAAVPPLQPPDAGRLCKRAFRGSARRVPLHLRGLCLHGPGPAHRAMPNFQVKETRIE